MKLSTVTAALLLTMPAAAMAQTPQERIDAAMSRALAAGVPVALLEAKIAEGMAKGVPMERLAAAIDRREAALERANAAMAGSGAVEPDQLSMGADAIGAGVSEAVLTQLSQITEGSRRAVAIAALTQLVAAGHVPQHALDQVIAAHARGGDALANLPAQAAEAAARRGPPAGVGRPATPGAPAGVGAPQLPAGVPAGMPAPGQKPQVTPPGNRPPVVPPGSSSGGGA
jgi:hypothetical protein